MVMIITSLDDRLVSNSFNLADLVRAKDKIWVNRGWGTKTGGVGVLA